MNQIAINTSQNVNIHFSVASIANRMLAFAIDMVIKISYLLFLYLILFELFDVSDVFSHWDGREVFAFLTIITLPTTFYTLVLESLMEGQTFGKRIAKIKVVKIDGYQATFSDYLIRWFFRLIDIWFSSSVVGVLAILLNKEGMRLGGIASGTAVIDLRNQVNIGHTILTEIEQEYQPTYSQVRILTDNDMRIIKDNYRKAANKRDYQLMMQLGKKVAETLELDVDFDETPARKFIETVIRDFNYYTGEKN